LKTSGILVKIKVKISSNISNVTPWRTFLHDGI